MSFCGNCSKKKTILENLKQQVVKSQTENYLKYFFDLLEQDFAGCTRCPQNDYQLKSSPFIKSYFSPRFQNQNFNLLQLLLWNNTHQYTSQDLNQKTMESHVHLGPKYAEYKCEEVCN